MIEMEALRELVAFHRYGTLSAAADELRITQPTMTRAMRKLERDLGVTLFDRSARNRLSLTPTGELAAEEASRLLDDYARFVETVRSDARLRNEIIVASVAPGPLHFLASLEHSGDTAAAGATGAADAATDTPAAHITIRYDLIDPEVALDELLQRKATLVFTDREIDDPRVESLYLGREFLGVAIDNFNPLAQHPSVTFADLSGMSFIVASDIGPWRTLIEQRIPGARFLYQQDLSSLEQISRYSAFPFFYSNLTRSSPGVDERFVAHTRTPVAIDDPANRIDCYATFLTDDRHVALPIQQRMALRWPHG